MDKMYGEELWQKQLVVILQMNASDYSGNTTGSPTVSSAGGVVTLTYTGSGTYVHS